MKKILLVVCTGNTCRSPMLSALLQKELGLRGKTNEWEIVSAGTALVAEGGFPAPKDAISAMSRRAIDLKSHRSRFVGPLLGRLPIAKIFCLTKRHKECLLGLEPGIPRRSSIDSADEDVPDPFEKGEEEYERCAKVLETLATKIVDSLDNKKDK